MMTNDNQTRGENELIDKLSDPIWRLNNLYYVQSKNEGRVKFRFNFVQKLIIKYLHWRMLFLKARQLGVSTFIDIFFLDQILFHKGKKAAIVADKEENAKTIFGIMEFAWENLSPKVKAYLKIECVKHSSTEMEFSNGSSVKVGTTIHSGTYQYLHVSELGPLCADSPEKAEKVMKSALPTVPSEEGTYIFIESTAEGEGNEFHSRSLQAQADTELAEAIDKENPSRALPVMDYRFVFFAWWENPEYTTSESESRKTHVSASIKAYLEEMEKRLDVVFTNGQKAWYYSMSKGLKDRMREQYPSYPEEAFLSSGGKLFDFDILKEKLKTDVREPYEVQGSWKFYTPYKRGHRYGLGADVSMGVGNHHSTAAIIDFTDLEVVATYQDKHIAPVPFAFELANGGNRYGTCIAAPEMNSIGYATVQKLAEIYPNVYRYHIKGYTEEKETERLGWLTNSGTKGNMLYELKEILENDEKSLKVRDPVILREAISYTKEAIVKTETVERMKEDTAHSDLLIATAIAFQMNAYAAIGGVDEDAEVEPLIAERRDRVRRFV